MTAQPAPFRSNRHPVLGDLPDLKADALAFWLDVARRGPVVGVRFGPAKRLIVNDPEVAQHILQANHRNYTKDRRLAERLETGTGPVLATSDGEDWRWRRKLMQPTFKPASVAEFANDIAAETRRRMQQWDASEPVDLASEMKILTMNIIGRVLFGVDFESESRTMPAAYAAFGAELTRRATAVAPAPLWLPTAHNRSFRSSIDTLEQFMVEILRDRRADPKPHADLLNMLLTYRLEDDGSRFSESDLIHEMGALVFAGHETTATAIAWAFAMIGSHRDVETSLRREIDEVLGDRAVTPADLERMPYLDQVIEETLRLWPPLYINSRQAVEADQLGSYKIEPGTRLLINILGIHRQGKHWPSPAKFDPERFQPDAIRRRHRFAHVPFLRGPRMCIGASLSMLEIKMIVVQMLQAFNYELTEKGPIEGDAGVVLAPKHGVLVKLKPRAAASEPVEARSHAN